MAKSRKKAMQYVAKFQKLIDNFDSVTCAGVQVDTYDVVLIDIESLMKSTFNYQERALEE